MKKLINIMLAALIALALPCTANGINAEQQQCKTTAAKKTTTQRKKTTTARKHATAAKKKTTQRKKTDTKKKRSTKQNNAKYSTAEIRGLQSKCSGIQKEIKKQEEALRANKADVKKRLNDLLILNSEIDRHKQNIDGIQRDITHLDGNIGLLNAQLATLQQQLKERKAKYVKSMRYISRQHTMQDRLMFIFSAKSLTEMYRRLRFVREYSSWQKAQGEMVKSKQLQVNEKQKQLQQVRGQKNVMLNKGRQEHRALESKQSEQQTMVNSLQKQQKTIQSVIAKQRKDASALNAQIDRLVAIEVEKARKRAEEEARRKAAEAAAAKKRREEELARKRAEAERARTENERRLREAREAEERAKQRAREATAQQKERAEQQAREAEAQREAIERKAKEDERRSTKEIANAKREVEQTYTVSSVDRMMSGGFEANRGRLPMPVSGGYRIVSHYGQNTIEGLRGVTLDNKGINIKGQPGCQARAVYDGIVSAVYGIGGQWLVMVRHGVYISVYCNLTSVGVHKDQKVSTGQALGAVGGEGILQFQLHKNSTRLNPEPWLRR
ncbi:MAG: peptidoglycan DD-metalloendopeptidase family protein [Prevotella sp.]|nr:peptidoglycan DD-metalloendopeptidase family protein [Prevotella sp.]MDY4804687.1 peptidoglycan DD-metalloendopeptidase family protein [Prevotella sp.]